MGIAKPLLHHLEITYLHHHLYELFGYSDSLNSCNTRKQISKRPTLFVFQRLPGPHFHKVITMDWLYATDIS